MGVPQGSVLEPLLIFLYTGDLVRIVMKYKLGFHLYADDTRIYGHCNDEGTEKLQMRIIRFKIALQMYKRLFNEGSAYLTRDLVPVASLPEKQRLRSVKSKDVVPIKQKLKSLGLRRFSVSGPKLWNNLPNSLKSSSSTKSFCRSLKTYLFNKSFPPS